MKILSMENMKLDNEYVEEIGKHMVSKEFVNEIVKIYGALPEEYYDEKTRRHIANLFIVNITPLYHVFKGDITGKSILDLGCGSTGGTYETKNFDPKIYEPWMCRALHKLGAHPIGVDIGELEGEKFEHHQVDLLKPDSLRFLETNSIDAAHEKLLYHSPTLQGMKGYKNLRGILVPQLERIVKPDGYFLESDLKQV